MCVCGARARAHKTHTRRMGCTCFHFAAGDARCVRARAHKKQRVHGVCMRLHFAAGDAR